VRGLFDWGKGVVMSALREPALYDGSAQLRAATRDQLFERVRFALGDVDGCEAARGGRTRLAHTRIVRAAEDYALAHGSDRSYVSDLCRVTGVSERTLEYAFKDVLGLTPIAYLARLRLHRVRQALLTASSGSTTVAAEALNWGFAHFGEFSHAYKDCFGELPSQTLRRGG
jgi:transcriptional regulator GlxA family with amidase domain